MALPTTVVGLCGYALLSKSGPLGFLGLLFTPGAIIIGETVLCFPIIIALAISTTQTDQSPGHGKLPSPSAPRPSRRPWRSSLRGGSAIWSAWPPDLRASSRRWAPAMMLGGNIKGHTRTLTTAIALETGKGEFSLGMALGIILLVLALAVNIPIQRLKRIGGAFMNTDYAIQITGLTKAYDTGHRPGHRQTRIRPRENLRARGAERIGEKHAPFDPRPPYPPHDRDDPPVRDRYRPACPPPRPGGALPWFIRSR